MHPYVLKTYGDGNIDVKLAIVPWVVIPLPLEGQVASLPFIAFLYDSQIANSQNSHIPPP